MSALPLIATEQQTFREFRGVATVAATPWALLTLAGGGAIRVNAEVGQMHLPSSLGAGAPSSLAVLWEDLAVLWEDGERVLCRGWRDDGDADRTAVLAVLSASEHPTP